MSIESNVIKMLSERTDTPLEKLSLTSQVNVDFVLDSLSFAELIMDLEDMYNIEISMEEATHFKTVQDIVEYLKRAAA